MMTRTGPVVSVSFVNPCVNMNSSVKTETLRWVGDHSGHLVMIDQTRLPGELVELECRDIETVYEAIQKLRVRGAPAIGIAAAYGVVIGLQSQQR